MKNKLRFVITVSVLFIFINTTFGQSRVALKTNVVCPNAPSVRLNSAQVKLTQIEGEINNIQSSRVFTSLQSDAIVKAMNDYSDDMTVAFEETLKAVERVARINTTGGDAELAQFQNFETAATEHQQRVITIQENLEVIEKSVANGLIQAIELPSPDSKLTESVFFQKAGYLPKQTNFNSAVNIPDSSLVSKSVAIPCIAPCVNKIWQTCISCVLPIAFQISSKWNQLNSCWNGCNGARWWQRAACKAGCVVTFVKWVA